MTNNTKENFRTKFHTDQPIKGDGASPDLLHRKDFAERIGASLLLEKGSPCLVLSIEGQWGFGKTSLINLINAYYDSIEESKKPLVFNFNPWMVGEAENIIQQFLIQFASVIGLSDYAKDAKEASNQLVAYSSIFSLLSFVPGAEPWASIIKNIFSAIGKSTGDVADLKELNAERKRDKVIEELEKIERPIVVFIDDLDRLPPVEIYQMFRVIKAITDFPRTVFVLAFDPNHIEESLKQHAISEPKQYLDKIVQARIPLPVISDSDIHTIAETELSNLSNKSLTQYFEGDQKRLTEFYHLSIKPLFKTPRDIKRVFNRLRFIVNSVKEEISFSDIFALEVLSIKAPEIYQHIRMFPEAYIGKSTGIHLGLEEPKKIVEGYQKVREEIISKAPKEDQKCIAQLLKGLFPLLDQGWTSFEGEKHYSSHGRVAALDRLMIAFSFGLPSDEVASKTVIEYISVPDKRELLLKSVLQQDQLERFIDLLLLKTDSIQPQDIDGFLCALGELVETEQAKQLKTKPKDTLDPGPILRCWWITKNILMQQGKDARKEILLKYFGSSSCLTISTQILAFLMEQQGILIKDKIATKDEQWCNNEEFSQLKEKWIGAVSLAIEDSSIFELTGAGNIIYILSMIDPDKTKELLEPLLKNDDTLDKLVLVIGPKGRDSVKGNYSQVDDKLIEILGGKESVRKRVNERIGKGNIDNIALKAIYNNILTGERYYLANNTKAEHF